MRRPRKEASIDIVSTVAVRQGESSLTTTANETEQAFRLVPPLLPEDGQLVPTFELSWCTSQETARMLANTGAKDIYVLLVVEQDGHELQRIVVPIKEPMRYVALRRPGRSTIHGTLVWRKYDEFTERSGEELAHYELDPEYILTKKTDSDYYRADVLGRVRNDDGDFSIKNDFDMINRLEVEDSLVVDVPEEMFARSWWITRKLGTLYGERWFGKKAKDACSMRRRAILTAVSSPIAAVLAVIVAAVVVVAFVAAECYHVLCTLIQMLFGMRGIDYDAVLHPWDELGERWKWLDNSVWLYKKKTDGHYQRRITATFFLNPAALAIAAGIGSVLTGMGGGAKHFNTDWVLYAVYAELALGALFLVLDARAGSPVAKWIVAKLDARDARLLEEAKSDIELLACDNRSTAASYSAVPRRRRTIRLRYAHIKSKVCQPFAS